MNIIITRQLSTLSGTPGRLTVTDAAGTEFSCATLELRWFDNKPGVSCIVADTYSATVWRSAHLGCDTLRLEDKHGRQDCLIHCGNFAGEQALGLEAQVQGCTLVGSEFGSLLNEAGNSQFAILDSRATLAKLIAFVGHCQHDVEYRWASGGALQPHQD